MSMKRSSRHAPLLLALALLSPACDRDPVDGPGPEPPAANLPSCTRQTAVVHTGSITTEIWRGDKVHVLRDSVFVAGTLAIEPGTLVCGDSAAALIIDWPAGRLDATGTATSRITFTATDSAKPWAGISVRRQLCNPNCPVNPSAALGDSSRMENTRISGANDRVGVVGSNVVINNCSVAGSRKAGVSVIGGDNIQIRGCVLENNGGAGVDVGAQAGRVDARFNWWGDAAGPLGPMGDGIVGDVDFSSHLTARPMVPTGLRPGLRL
jgi:hypothetical protein